MQKLCVDIWDLMQLLDTQLVGGKVSLVEVIDKL